MKIEHAYNQLYDWTRTDALPWDMWEYLSFVKQIQKDIDSLKLNYRDEDELADILKSLILKKLNNYLPSVFKDIDLKVIEIEFFLENSGLFVDDVKSFTQSNNYVVLHFHKDILIKLMEFFEQEYPHIVYKNL